MRQLLIAILFFTIAGLQGCTYVKNRGNDFVDIFQARMTFGPGIMASMRATQGMSAGFGMVYHAQAYGLRGRGIGHWEVYRGEAGLTLLGVPMSLAHLKEFKATYVYGNQALKDSLEGNTLREHKVFPLLPGVFWPLATAAPGDEVQAADELLTATPIQQDRGLTEVGLQGHLLLIGADVGIDLLEVFDFVLGFFLLDFQGDDTNSIIRNYLDQRDGELTRPEKKSDDIEP